MGNLVVTVLSLILVVALTAFGAFSGGSALTDAEARAVASKLKNEEQQLLGAMEIFRTDRGTWPQSLADLVAQGYLKAIPQGAVAAVPKAGFELIRSAHAQEQSGWVMPVPGQPIIVTSSRVPVEVCRKYNLASRGDDGILKQAFAVLNAQCFGLDKAYRVVAMRPGSEAHLGQAVAPDTFVTGDLPAVVGGEQWWGTDPTGELQVPTDPVKSGKAQLELRPGTPLEFGSVQVGQRQLSDSRLVVNTGQVQAESLDIELPTGFGLATNTCLQGVMAGGSCSFSVEFQPTAARSYAGTAVLRGPRGAELSFSLGGEGLLPSATLVIPPFPPLDVGSFAANVGYVTNTGSGPLGITLPTSASVSGAGFSFVSTNCPTELSAGARCVVSVSFEPVDASAAVGTLKITTSAGELTANLSGQGMQARLVADVSTLDFGVQTVNSSTVRSVRITNVGTSYASSLATQSISAGYEVNGSCGVLAPGESCDVAVTFMPATGGAFAGSYVVQGRNLSPLTLLLNGLAVPPTASLSSVAFGDLAAGNTKDLAATLTNTSSVPLAVTTPGASSVQGAGFAYLGNNCPATLAVGASCTINIRYTATGSAAASGSLTVATAAGNLTANLTGQGLQARVDAPPPVDFGKVFTGETVTRQVTLTNTGNVATSINAITTPGQFDMVNNGCGSLAPGASCTFSLQFSPNEARSYSANVLVLVGSTMVSVPITAVSEVGWDKTKISLLINNCSVSGDQSMYDYHWINNTNEMVGLVSVKYGNNPEVLYPQGYVRMPGPFTGPRTYSDGPCGLPVVLKFSNGQTIAY